MSINLLTGHLQLQHGQLLLFVLYIFKPLRFNLCETFLQMKTSTTTVLSSNVALCLCVLQRDPKEFIVGFDIRAP